MKTTVQQTTDTHNILYIVIHCNISECIAVSIYRITIKFPVSSIDTYH